MHVTSLHVTFGINVIHFSRDSTGRPPPAVFTGQSLEVDLQGPEVNLRTEVGSVRTEAAIPTGALCLLVCVCSAWSAAIGPFLLDSRDTLLHRA